MEKATNICKLMGITEQAKSYRTVNGRRQGTRGHRWVSEGRGNGRLLMVVVFLTASAIMIDADGFPPL
jgi:hypothetical protein